MHSHLSEVFARLDDSRRILAAAIDAIPEPLRRVRPAPDRWSVAEVLEHLAKVDRFFTERITGAIAEARAAGLGAEAHARESLPAGVVETMANRSDRREARDMVMPSGAVDVAAAWADLDRARDEVRTAVRAADGLALSTVKAEHRFFGLLTVYQWVELTAAHEIRHAAQIDEIRAALV